ncbi:endonuclease domain-containing protein [uncultured Phenylobacterium sp.]|uniref:endonuclease domain-containing protein n=1 Tax=uncultured Phenylobacterium sp. TaxID=349273 RepID=UPI00345D1B28
MRPEIVRAREFRTHMSEPEVALWSRLKRLRDRGFRFRRQAPFRGYYLDFVCYTRRVVIEVDGGQHADDPQSEHDFVRDRVLVRHGFRVLRFWASDVRGDLGGVMDHILLVLDASRSTRDGQEAGDGSGARRSGPTAPPYRFAVCPSPLREGIRAPSAPWTLSRSAPPGRA